MDRTRCKGRRVPNAGDGDPCELIPSAKPVDVLNSPAAVHYTWPGPSQDAGARPARYSSDVLHF